MIINLKIRPKDETALKEMLYTIATRQDGTEMSYNGETLNVKFEGYHIPGDVGFLGHQIIAFLEWLGEDYRYDGAICEDQKLREEIDHTIKEGLGIYDCR